MVKLTKIYTKSGDDGTTGLGSGRRVPKNHIRVEAYGTVDEANAAIGLAISLATAQSGGADILSALESVQHDLFDVGADLCVPGRDEGDSEHPKLRVQPHQTERLEALIDEHNAKLANLTSFILPGGTQLAASLHLARTVARRAERAVLTLMEQESDEVNPETLRFLNRLSDLLFVLARVANIDRGDVLWKPGQNRGE